MKTIIEMAREAGFMAVTDDDPEVGALYECFTDELERFAELVRADARDCVMNESITKAHWQRFENDIRADERAALIHYFNEHWRSDWSDGQIIEAIEARGNT